MIYTKTSKARKMQRSPLAIVLAFGLCLSSCAHKPPIVLTEYVKIDLVNAEPAQKVDQKFKTPPPSQILKNVSRGDIQVLRAEGSHDNAAQIANLCLSDFEGLDISFSDLVGEINTIEAEAEIERQIAQDARTAQIEKLKALNSKIPEPKT